MKELEPTRKGPGKGDRNRSVSSQYRRAYDEIDWHRERRANTVKPNETKSKPVSAH